MKNRESRNHAEHVSMSLGDHIEELRARLFRCILAVLGALVVSWFFRYTIMRVLALPHELAMQAFQLDPALKFRTYSEPLAAHLKACLVVSLVVTSPLLLYQMWVFVAPGLFRRERRMVMRLGMVSLLCFLAGVGFGYFLFIPLALRFLIALAGPGTEPVLMIGPYLSLLFMLTLVLGSVFQTPVIMYYLVRWDVLSVETVQEHRKTAILAGFVLAAFLTPPDPFTQIAIAVPLVILYDIGALVAAPGRRTIVNFARFAGTVTVILVIVGGIFFLWPVGRITATSGAVKVGGDVLPSGTTASLRRGQVCTVETDGAARVELGRKRSAPTLLIAGGTQVQVHGGRAVSIHFGRAFANNPGGAPVEIRSVAARATLRTGKAELIVPEPHTLVVNVAEGEVTVRADGRTSSISAGRTATFRRGGEPLQPGDIEDLRRRIMQGQATHDQ